MDLRETIVFKGNMNRITEMRNAGVGDFTIAGAFRDHGMEVNGELLSGNIAFVEEVSKRALSKKYVKKVIKAFSTMSDEQALHRDATLDELIDRYK